MRTPFVVWTIGMLAGCATWQAESARDVRPSAEGRVLLVLQHEALDLDDARVEGDEIRGRPLGRWSFPGGELGEEALAYLKETNDSPAKVAEHLSWSPASIADETAQVPIAQLVLLRKYDPRTGATIAATAGAIVGGLAALLAIAVAIIAASWNPSCGRPLRVRGRRVVTGIASASGSSGWSEPIAVSPVPEPARRALAEVWTREARAEHAAVAAFSKTALELMALGAPPDLVARANRAAIQEVEHARLCFAVASAYTGRPLEPAPLPEALAGDEPDLLRLARESLLDGCLREGLASEIASLGAEHARDPQIVRVLRVQAKEEAQHAAFSWAIVEWALLRGGQSMRRSLLRAVDELEFPRCDDLPEHGRVGRALVEPRFHRIRADARERLASPCATQRRVAVVGADGFEPS